MAKTTKYMTSNENNKPGTPLSSPMGLWDIYLYVVIFIDLHWDLGYVISMMSQHDVISTRVDKNGLLVGRP